VDKLNGPMENLNAANYTGAGRACQGLFIGGSACSLKKTARSEQPRRPRNGRSRRRLLYSPWYVGGVGLTGRDGGLPSALRQPSAARRKPPLFDVLGLSIFVV